MSQGQQQGVLGGGELKEFFVGAGIGTPAGGMTVNGGLAAGFDGDTDEPFADCARSASAVSGYDDNNAIGKQWPAAKIVSRGKWWGPNNSGVNTSGTSPRDFKLQGSDNGSDWTDLATGSINTADSGQSAEVASTVLTPYGWHRLVLDGNAINQVYCAEAQFWELIEV